MKNAGSNASATNPTVLTVTLALPLLLASLGTSIANVALPALGEAFAAPFPAVQLVAVGYLASMTASTVFVGRLGDVHGHQRVLVAGLSLFAGASLLAAFAPNLPMLVATRAIQGVGAAVLMTLSLTLMRELGSGQGVGRAMGLLGTVSAVGTALGPSLGGLLLPLAGWRAIFLVQVPLAVVALVLAVTVLPRRAGVPDRTPVPVGSVVNARLVRTLAVNSAVAAVMMTTLIVGPFYLTLGLGLRAVTMGMVMSVGPVVAIVSGAPSGRLVDALGTKHTMTIGLALMATGAVAMAVLPGALGTSGYLIALVAMTPGYQLVQAASATDALLDVARAQRGAVSGFLVLSRNLGLIAGASVMGAIFAAGVGDDVAVAGPDAITSGMRLTFLVAAGLIGLSFGISQMRRM